MQSNTRFNLKTLALGIFLSFMSFVLSADPLEVMNHQGISYVSGGIGDEEQNAIKELADDYNLELMMALKSGHYIADVSVSIADEQGNTLLETVTEGPFLLINLEPGKYTVEAQYQGSSQRKSAYLDRDEHEQLNFYW